MSDGNSIASVTLVMVRVVLISILAPDATMGWPVRSRQDRDVYISWSKM